MKKNTGLIMIGVSVAFWIAGIVIFERRNINV